MSIGDPISSSRVVDELRARAAARFDANFSFNTLKSGKTGVEGICGDAEALRACRITFGERNRSAGG